MTAIAREHLSSLFVSLEEVCRNQDISLPKETNINHDLPLIEVINALGINVLYVLLAAKKSEILGLPRQVRTIYAEQFSREVRESVGGEEEGGLENSFQRLKECATKFNFPQLDAERREFFNAVDALGKEALVHYDGSFNDYYPTDKAHRRYSKDSVVQKQLKELGTGVAPLSTKLFLMRAGGDVNKLDCKTLGVDASRLTDEVVKLSLRVLNGLDEADFRGAFLLTPQAFEGGHQTLRTLTLSGTTIGPDDFSKDQFQSLTVVRNNDPKRLFRWPANPEEAPQNLDALLHAWRDCRHSQPIELDLLKRYFKEFVTTPTLKNANLFSHLMGDFFLDVQFRKDVEDLIFSSCLEVLNNFSAHQLEGDVSHCIISNLRNCLGFAEQGTVDKFREVLCDYFEIYTNVIMTSDKTHVATIDGLSRMRALLNIARNEFDSDWITKICHRIRELGALLKSDHLIQEKQEATFYEIRYLIDHLVALSYSRDNHGRKDSTRSKIEWGALEEITETFQYLLEEYGPPTSPDGAQHPKFFKTEILPTAFAGALVAKTVKSSIDVFLRLIPKNLLNNLFPMNMLSSSFETLSLRGDQFPGYFKDTYISGQLWLDSDLRREIHFRVLSSMDMNSAL